MAEMWERETGVPRSESPRIITIVITIVIVIITIVILISSTIITAITIMYHHLAVIFDALEGEHFVHQGAS